MDAFEILVVILSITLGILLIVSIIFVYSLIKLANEARKIAEKASSIVDDVESVSENIKKATSSRIITSFLASVLNSVGKFNSDKDK